MKRPDKSFGPSASIDHETLAITLSCSMCIFRLFPQHACRAEDPPRQMEPGGTPEWCRYRDGILEDVEAAKARMIRDRALIMPEIATKQ